MGQEREQCTSKIPNNINYYIETSISNILALILIRLWRYVAYLVVDVQFRGGLKTDLFL